jgi:electron transfer flavoprotein beta subunit
MNVVVCVKQVPDVESRVVVEKGEISIQGLIVSDVINPQDLMAIEEALRIKEADGEGQVTLVSLGTPGAEEALRKGIAMGANEAILFCDAAFEGGDSYATAVVLAKAISAIPHDLVFCGQRADDTQSGQVGVYLAKMLGVPVVRGVVKVEENLAERKLKLQRKLEKGDREVVECPIPALLTVETGLNSPRNPTIKGVLRAKNKEITRRDLKQLQMPAEEAGAAGSKIKVTHISPPKPKMKGLFVPDSKMSSFDKMRAIMEGGITQKKSDFLEGDPKDIAAQIIRFLREQKIIPG